MARALHLIMCTWDAVSYHLHSNHHFLSTWGVVMLKINKEERKSVFPGLNPNPNPTPNPIPLVNYLLRRTSALYCLMCANTSGVVHINLIFISALNKRLISSLNKTFFRP